MTMTETRPARKYLPPLTRVSFERLEEYIHSRWGPDPVLEAGFVHCNVDQLLSNDFIGRQCGGLHHGSVLRWRRHDIPLHTADRIAHGLGVHPEQIWPGYNHLPYREESS